MSGDSTPDQQHPRRELRVAFEVEPAPENGCPLGGFDGRIEEVRHQLSGDTCHTDTTIQTDECECASDRDCTEVVYRTADIGASCPCAVFGEFDCVPEIVDIVDGRLQIETYLSDRKRLSELVESLRDVTGRLRLRKLKRIDTGDLERSRNVVTLDLFELTETQRETVATAVAEGYYSSPRETSVAELAAEFGISPSALSQRLNTVESKLATAAFTEASVEG